MWFLQILEGEERGTSGVSGMSDQSSKVVYPDIAQMVIYEPAQKPGKHPCSVLSYTVKFISSGSLFC